MKRIFIPLAVAAILGFATSCSVSGQQDETNAVKEEVTSDGGQSTVKDDESQKDIVKVAVGSADHSTLVKAVQAADLVNSLSNAGPFTVFAPVNSAFEQLPAGTVENLLKPENKAALSDILEYHVTVSVYEPEKFYDGQVLGQVNGQNATVHVKDGKISINDANIIGTVRASNGIIHILDKVLLPPKK